MEDKELISMLSQCLCPPGDGVYTVHTASEKKAALQHKLYPQATDIKTNWINSLTDVLNATKPTFLGIASDNGGGILRGANWGPLFIREAYYQQYAQETVQDLGDVRIIPHLLHDKYLNEQTRSQCQKALYGKENQWAVSPLSLALQCLEAIYLNHPKIKIIGLGGDHSCSYPLVKTALQNQKRLGQRCGLLHFDAHTDLLEQRLGIDLCFGSWTTHIIKDLPSPACLCQVGIRSTGQKQTYWQEKYGLRQFWAEEVHQVGASKTAANLINHFQSQEIETLYITFDIDALDISIASATGTPEPGGLLREECVEIIQACSRAFEIIGADLMELAPFVCHGTSQQEPRTTLDSAVEILAQLIGA